jgi:chemotaxis protein MotB
MSKRKKEESAGMPEWMCTYGDMMSLLLCFFIMLFAMSIITPIKWEAFIETQQMRMGYEGQSRTPSQSKKPSAALGSISERSRRNAAMSGGQPEPGPAGENRNRQTISDDGTLVKGGLIRFALGSDQLTKQAEKDLEALQPTLKKSPNKIVVVGYAAPAEEEEGSFSRGIYLAQSRATTVMEYLVSLDLPENFFEIGISTSIPNRAILPKGTPPRQAGASAAVYLRNGTPRPVAVEKE